MRGVSVMVVAFVVAVAACAAEGDQDVNPERVKEIDTLGVKNDAPSRQVLLTLVQNEKAAAYEREAAVKALAKTKDGGLALLELAEDDKLAEELKATACLACVVCPDETVRAQGEKTLPPPRTKDGLVLPGIEKLAAMSGDAKAGREVFRANTDAKCINCHQIGDEGKMVGPPLSTIGEKLSKQQLYEAILTPSASILMGYENWVVKLKSGERVCGLLVENTDDHITLKDTEAGFHDYPAAEVVTRTRQAVSLMPEGMAKTMTKKELVDLVEYLSQLKYDGGR